MAVLTCPPNTWGVSPAASGGGYDPPGTHVEGFTVCQSPRDVSRASLLQFSSGRIVPTSCRQGFNPKLPLPGSSKITTLNPSPLRVPMPPPCNIGFDITR